MTDEFEGFVEKAITHELKPQEHAFHPSLSIFLDFLSEDLSPGAQSKVSAHLATCPTCLERFRSLEEILGREHALLKAKVGTLSLPKVFRALKEKRLATRLRKVFTFYNLSPRPTLALVPITLILVILGVTVPLVHISTTRLSDLAEEVTALRKQISTLSGEIGTIPSMVTRIPSWEEVGELATLAQRIADPWEKALFIAAEFNARGWTLPRNVDWGKGRIYVVRSGDTWESVALQELGAEDLAPFLYLLNVNEGATTKLVPGQEIKLPGVRGG